MTHYTIRAFVAALTATLLPLTPANAQTEETVAIPAAETFEEMKALVGHWQKADGAVPHFEIVFESFANDTVLKETWTVHGATHSVSMYRMDGDTIIATHYCPQGNQPRLALTSPGTDGAVSFTFQDATGLASLGQSHQHALKLRFPQGEQPFVREEMYLSAEGEEWSALTLKRAKENG